MNGHLRLKADLLASNMQMLKGKFVWQSILLKRLAALLYAARGSRINMRALQESYDLIKEDTSWTSYFRGNSMISVATLLSLHENRRRQLANTLDVYERMKKSKFWSSDYLVIAAYQIAEGTSEEKYTETIRRTKGFYDGIKAQHRFITGQDDYIFSALLGLSSIEIEDGLKQMEILYQALKPHFRSFGAVQTLSQVLTLGGKDADAVNRVLCLSDAFRQRGMSMNREYTLPSLGVLSLLPTDDNTLVDEVIEVYEMLRTKKGFGPWSVSKQELLLLSSALVSYEYADEVGDCVVASALSTSLTNIIVAQQTAVAVMVATSSATASSDAT